MLVPPLAKLLWGFEDMSGSYQCAMGYGASLMLGWTALLIWAYQKPLERKVIAALTVLVIYGLIFTEIVAVLLGHLAAWRMLPIARYQIAAKIPVRCGWGSLLRSSGGDGFKVHECRRFHCWSDEHPVERGTSLER